MKSTEPDDLSSLISRWPGEPSLAVATPDRLLGTAGDTSTPRHLASITKLFTCYATLVAIEEGTLALDQPAGPRGSTVRHLMAHASGLMFDTHNLASGVGERRVYSNTGIEVLADHLAFRSGIAFADYLHEGVLQPIGLGHLRLTGSPAHALVASVDDLVVFGRELLSPTLVASATLAEATSPVYPELRGVLPGFGLMAHNTWGLGFEIKGDKVPHWTAPAHPPTTFGHFGGAGSFLWIDPEAQMIGASAGTEPFGEWAVAAWPVANGELARRYH